MLSNRPYLLRAFYQWIVDSNVTPILVIDATNPKCSLPMDFAEGGEIVFNVSPTAVRDFQITNSQIEFNASFSGIVHHITAPVSAILALYAEENGEGLFLDAEEDEVEAPKTHLRSIDGTSAETLEGFPVDSIAASRPKPELKLVE